MIYLQYVKYNNNQNQELINILQYVSYFEENRIYL